MITTANDQRYQLSILMIEELRNTDKYKALHNQIINNGYYTVNDSGKVAKIFTAELSYLLFSTDIKLFNLDKQIEENINAFNYLKIFFEAFQQGEKYFDNEFKVTTSTIYGDNSEIYLKDIHDNYFHTEHLPPHKGWHFVKNSFPFIITEKAIFNFGYYSGITAKADQLFDKYSNAFDKVRTCESVTNSVEKYKPFYNEKKFTDFTTKTKDNVFYLGNYFADWKVRQNNTIDENPSLTDEVKEKLKSFNYNVYDFANEVIQLYKGVCNNDNNIIHIRESKIDYRLSQITHFAEIVKYYEAKDEFIIANKIKKHCLMILKNAIDNLNDIFEIEVLKTTTKTFSFEEHLQFLERTMR